MTVEEAPINPPEDTELNLEELRNDARQAIESFTKATEEFGKHAEAVRPFMDTQVVDLNDPVWKEVADPVEKLIFASLVGKTWLKPILSRMQKLNVPSKELDKVSEQLVLMDKTLDVLNSLKKKVRPNPQ